MSLKFLLFFSLNIYNIFCRKVEFNVISFGQKTYVKIVDGDKYKLSPIASDDILYRGSVSNAPNESFQYFYIVDDEEENFVRTFDSNINVTYNEFYGRKDTIKPLKTFNHPPNLSHWNRSIGKTTLFDDSYIPTLHITGSNAENFFHDPKKYESKKLENVKFYLKDSVETFKNVKTSSKNRSFSKFQFQLWLDDEDDSSSSTNGIKGRYILKLRNGSEDPLNLRQFIYGNIIQAIGMPSLHSVMVRVYYNKKPVGFYTLQESVITYSFIKAEFYGNPLTETIRPPKTLGYVLDGTTGADFEYKPDDYNYYGVFDTKSDEAVDQLIEFCKALSELNTANDQELAEFDKKWFDIDTFHKAMAMEYLTGDWDGYWYTTSNFAIYDDPTQSTSDSYKFYFITQDHDETFGVGLTEDFNEVGKKFPELSYTTMINRKWHIVDDDAEYRTLVDKFIGSTPKLQKRFEETLISIVIHIFNPVAFQEVVNSYYERYEPEVKWDFSFTRPYIKNQNPDFGYKDFLKNFEQELPGLNWGIYEWVKLRAESIKNEFCITWLGDTNPPSNCVNNYDYIPIEVPTSTDVTSHPKATDTLRTESTINIPIDGEKTTSHPSISTTTTNNETTETKETSESTTTTEKHAKTTTKKTTTKKTTKTKTTKTKTTKTTKTTTTKTKTTKTKTTKTKTTKKTTTKTTTKTKTTKMTTTKTKKTKTKTTTTTKKNSASIIISNDGSCGKFNNYYKVCPNDNCCSKFGYCGSSDAFCGTGCQSEFGRCNH